MDLKSSVITKDYRNASCLHYIEI